MIFTKEIQQSMISIDIPKKGITLLKTYIAEKSVIIDLYFLLRSVLKAKILV